MKNSKRDFNNYPYMNIKESWMPYVYNCVDEVDKLLSIYDLSYDVVEYLEIKDNENQLKIYYLIPNLMNVDLSDEDYLLYHTLEGMISLLVDKHERKVKIAIEKGLL